MESIKTTLADLTEHFNTQMNEFQRELRNVAPATSPTSNIHSQFASFRAFVLTALESIQLQVTLLSRQCDDLEMRSRKKILLVHGVAEVDKEDIGASVSKILCEHLKLPQITCDSFSRCHRLGHSTSDKPRAVLLKFKDGILKDKVWSAKTGLKGTGITVAEFLTKARYRTFLEARQRFGIAKCWTRDGMIMVLGADGVRHRITTMAELSDISVEIRNAAVPSVAPTKVVEVVKNTKAIIPRSKRFVRK